MHKCIKLHEKTLDKLKNRLYRRFFACFSLTENPETVEISTLYTVLRIIMHVFRYITIWLKIDIYWQMAIFQRFQAFWRRKIDVLSVQYFLFTGKKNYVFLCSMYTKYVKIHQNNYLTIYNFLTIYPLHHIKVLTH